MSKIIGLTFDAPAEKHICPHCGEEFKSKKALNRHLEEKHPEPDPAEDP